MPGRGWSCGEATVDYSVRRIVLLAVAGVASLICSCWGLFAWAGGGAASSHSILLVLHCLCPALALAGFTVYVFFHRAGLILTWLLALGTFASLFLNNLHDCAHGNCTTTNVLAIAEGTFTGMPILWLQVAAAVCQLLDYSEAAVLELRSRRDVPAGPPPGN